MVTASAKCPWCESNIFKDVPSDCYGWVAFECFYDTDCGSTAGCGKLFVGFVRVEAKATEMRKVPRGRSKT